MASKADMLDKDGKLPRIKGALMADAIGTTAGAMLGTSTVTKHGLLSCKQMEEDTVPFTVCVEL